VSVYEKCYSTNSAGHGEGDALLGNDDAAGREHVDVEKGGQPSQTWSTAPRLELATSVPTPPERLSGGQPTADSAEEDGLVECAEDEPLLAGAEVKLELQDANEDERDDERKREVKDGGRIRLLLAVVLLVVGVVAGIGLSALFICTFLVPVRDLTNMPSNHEAHETDLA